MEKLIIRIEKLKKSPLKKIIDERINEFKNLRNSKNEDLFKELCFCLMTANFQAEKSWEIQKEIDEGFWELSEKELKIKLREMGHRFWPQRASRIYEIRPLRNNIRKKLKELGDEKIIRLWLVENVKGLGMKEASHFLRNIGYLNVAIIDKHIINLLVEEDLIERPKTITPKKYLEIENLLKEISEKVGLNLGELDLYLWSEQTGKVLK
ncbi:MAG: N-glycosylase/DNA lyase [Nanoarchaeota archaeon]|nr:N-glycosylase/DNA lyase [Nanoarchaeota archaeon]